MDIVEEIKQLADAKLKFIEDVLRELKPNESLCVGNPLQEQFSTEPSLYLPIDNEIVKRFQMDENIGVDDQVQIVIVDALNCLMTGQNVFILRDKGNDSWICLHYKLISDKPKIVFLLPIPTDDFSWSNFHKYRQENFGKITGWLPPILFNVENPAELFIIENCQTSHNKSEQFLLALVYAFGCCLNFPKCYREPFGESKEMIRRAISKVLMEKRMPTIEELWDEPYPEPEC